MAHLSVFLLTLLLVCLPLPVLSADEPSAGLTDCLACHDAVNAQIQKAGSKHSRVACTACHQRKPEKLHGSIPDCLSCHKSHGAGQTTADCRKCHHAHRPMNIIYTMNTPIHQCGACHTRAYELLKGTTYKHGKLLCVECHQGRHKVTPQCKTCHGLPHDDEIHVRTPLCFTCHNTAHDLKIPPAGGGR